MNSMSEFEKVELEQDKVDNYLITACITLIASFTIIMSIKKPGSSLASYTYLVSLLFLITSLLTLLWHKFRFPKRRALFNIEQKYIIQDASTNIETHMEKIISPSYDISEELRTKSIIVHIENMLYKIKEKYDETYLKPLMEPHSKFKHLLDRFSKSARYKTFTVGIVFFFTSMAISLFM